ncbi:hypothetical protein KVR01_009052 [Diaporthe batatas]|uniref:uncharacterized protein n=1 Tax=Diaporthe batatas TaxID=748121 RepID=UPI001D05B58E|nr:uncharacterized protein KVR01_009052 [Diaporthe batatas]KAG8160788.1 hypothetical protein KVR01_009052 [Diaporthe batatas]
MAFMGAMELIGQLIGPIIGGSLTDNVSWRWCFLLNVPIGAVCGLVLAFLIRTNRQPWVEILHRLRGLDYLGIVILCPAVIFVLFVVNTGGTSYAWNSALIIAMIVLAVVLMAAFLIWEKRKADSALIPFRLIRNRNIVCAAIFAFSNGVAVAVYDYYIPLWYQTIKGYTAGDSGVLLLPLNACTAGGIILGGIIVDKIGFFNPIMMLGGTLTSVASGVLTTISLSTSKSRLMGYSALAGLGGLALQQPLTAAHNAVGKGPLSPSAMSLMLFSNMVGSSAGLAIAQAIFMGQLKATLSSVPGVRAEDIINSGASELRDLVDPQQLPRVMRLYNKSLTKVFFIGVGTAICMFGAGLFARWHRTTNKK